MAITVGTRLGSYEVLSLLGKGGMGDVYRARDTQLQREVALKLLPDAFASDPDRLARFEREAQILASLNHPNIAQIYGLEGTGASRCIVMELVDGPTLADRIRRPEGLRLPDHRKPEGLRLPGEDGWRRPGEGRGRPSGLPIDEALSIATQMADALEAAHARGIVHRDLKPANVKITPDERVKVLDFGLAKAMESAGAGLQDGPDTQSPTLSVLATQAGVILGTAAYMSPEQAKGKQADARSDIWAFGVVLYEMLTGQPAFDGDTIVEMLGGVMKGEPDWTALPPATPPGVRSLLRRCLQKDRDRRYRDIADVKIQIEEARSGPELPAAAAPSPPRGPSYVPRIVAAVLALALAALAIPGVIHLRETPPEMAVIRATILPPESTTFDFTNGTGLPALSPDGTRIVFGARAADGKQPLWVRALDGLTAQPLAGTEGATFPFWSPDSRFIAFFAEGKLKKIDAGGGPALTLADAPQGRGGSWSRDDAIVFSPSNDILQRVSSAGGASSAVSKEPGSFPWFLPDGEHFLYQAQGAAAVGQANLGELPIRVRSLDGMDDKVVGQGSNAQYAQGHLLFLREGNLMAQPFDADRLETTAEAVPLAEGIQTALNSGRVGVFSASGAGLLIYRQGAGTRRQLTWFDRAGKAVGTLGEPDENVLGSPELSPDGRRVVVERNVQGNPDVWLIDLLRGGSTRFTFDAAADRSPVWSLDGTQVVFNSNRRGARFGDYDLYMKPSSGGGAEQLLFDSAAPKIPYGWSADGRFLLYRDIDPKTAGDIWALPMQGDKKPVAVANSPFNESNGQFSPDGRWVAYHSNESGRLEIYVVPFPAGSGKWQISTDGGISPRWRRDGKELFFIGPDGQMMAAAISASGTSFEAASPVTLFQTSIAGGGGSGLLANVKHQYAVSADGRFLINVPAGDSAAAPLTLLQNWAPSRRN